jgi:putative mRNA 3-end processing factor
MADLVVRRPQGLYCPPGDFYIDPMRAVPHALITHAHADHARRGHGRYLAHRDSLGVLRARLGPLTIDGVGYGEAVTHNGVRISLHPAGHVLGSAQVRLEWQGQVWVVSGDYFVSGVPGDTNETCAPFEPVRCNCFITESTFGLPVYRWQAQAAVQAEIRAWWQACAAEDQTALLLGYSFGKAQRLLAALGHSDDQPGPIWVHPAVDAMCQAYRAAGVHLPAYRVLPKAAQQLAGVDLQQPLLQEAKGDFSKAIVVAPPALLGSAWAQRLPRSQAAFASGWMRLRSGHRRQRMDRGFVLSDHADWPGLTQAIAATGAERVIVMHGYEDTLCGWLREQGLQADRFGRESVPAEQADTLPQEAPVGNALGPHA